MITEFKVKNYKNFNKELSFSLDKIKNYTFNNEAIRDSIIKTSIIYGENGSGKSNLGLAIMDIRNHIIGKKFLNKSNNDYFINLSSKENSYFYYKFKFGLHYLEYKYQKDTEGKVLSEEIFIDYKNVIYYNHLKNIGKVNLEGTETLNTNLKGKDISFIKYIYNNSILKENIENKVFLQFIEFVDKMLIFNISDESYSEYFENINILLADKILYENKMEELKLFLNEIGVNYKIAIKQIDGDNRILCDFNGRLIDLHKIISRGIYYLTIFFYILLDKDKISFMYIDGIDSFCDNEMTKMIVMKILKIEPQVVFVTNNTSVISNDILRPDCYFNISKGKINSFAYSTDKEIRKAHNIEKMYNSGMFNEI